MVTEEEVLDALRSVLDPEMPINIVDLGIVDVVRIEPEGKVIVDILPTFVGCPALHVIEDQVRKRIAKLSGVKDVEVRIRFDPPWTVDRISGAGRDALQRVGITVPGSAGWTVTCSAPRSSIRPISATLTTSCASAEAHAASTLSAPHFFARPSSA